MIGSFVAREAEVARLLSALERAGAGDPSAVLVGADAGVGKSRLLGHVAELAAGRGATAVTAYCVDLGEVGLPYLPFADALAQLHALPGARETVEEVARTRPALARLVPGLDGAAVAIEDEANRLQLFDGLAAVLAAVGRPGHPLLLVVEDLHWADPSSRDVLRYLVARMRHENVLVVGSYRTDDLHRTHPLRPLLSEMWRHPRVERLDVAPFTAPELRAFATAVHGSPLSEAALHSVLERSEGNAYFAEELIEAGSGTTPGAGGALPWSLGEVLRSRLERVDAGVQQLTRIASVAGRTVNEPLLRAVAEEHYAGHDVDAVLRDAVAAHLLGWEDGRIAFRHALLAEVVYDDLLPGERTTLHRAFRDAIAADPALAPRAQLAHHAQACHDLPTALTASVAAADDAWQVLAPAEELRHLETVLELWDSVPGAADAAGADRVDVLDRAASAASRVGDLDRAVALMREAVASAPVDRAPRLRVTLARRLLGIDDEGPALAEATRALADLPADAPPSHRAWALATHARACLTSDRDGDARASAEAAIVQADLAGDDAAAADALATLAVLVVDDPDRAAALLTDARRRARDAGDLVTEQRCTHNLITTYYYAGRLDEAAATIEAAYARARECGLEWAEFGVAHRFFDVLVHYCRGDLAPQEGLRAAAPAGYARVPTLVEAEFEAVSLYAAVARGDADAVERGRALRPLWERDSQVALLSGGPTIDALTWAGRLDEAVELASELIEYLNRSWNDYFLGGIWLAALAIAALADGAAGDRLLGVDPALKVRTGDELLARAVATAERGRPRGGRLGPEGVAWLERARAEHGRLAGADDPELWRRAVDAFGYGYRYEEARSRWRLAEALLAAGDRDAARRELDLARAAAVAMGARPLREAVDALARRGRLEGGARGAGDVLTDREAEVLALVAQGLTNRQIGELLFISGKTVSVHVSNLLAKLGVAGRAEAVAVAHRRGLLAG